MTLFQYFLAAVFLSGGLIVLGAPSMIGVILAATPFFLVWVGYNNLLPFSVDDVFIAVYFTSLLWWLVSLAVARLK